MASRQRSFFDQPHKKARSNFHRARSANDAYPKPLTTAPSKPPPNAMPIAAGSQTKRKLKNFQFIPGAPTAEPSPPKDADKENMAPMEMLKTSKSDIAKATSYTADRSSAPAHRVSSQPHVLFPSTPVPRLPLSDLVGQDGPFDPAKDRDGSPEEHVQWKHHTPARSRGKKRPRSSSPVSAHMETIQEQTSFDMLPLSHTLKTPQADPAADLLSRYGINADTLITPDAAANGDASEVSNLGSSPRSVCQAGNVSGLRRWLSCGNQFPESRSPKRRRGIGAVPNGLEAFIESPSRAIWANDRNQRRSKTEIETLIGRITDLTDATRYDPDRQPSSSGPIPETRGFEIQSKENLVSNTAPALTRRAYAHSVSSRGAFGLNSSSVPQSHEAPKQNLQKTPERGHSQKQPSPSSSEYGSVDLGSDVYDKLDAIVAATQAAEIAVASQVQVDHPHLQPDSNANAGPIQSIGRPPPNTEPIQLDSDDFNFDDDLDLDDLVPISIHPPTELAPCQHQSRPSPPSAPSISAQVSANPLANSNDDDFDDFDVDFDDLVPVDHAGEHSAQTTYEALIGGSGASSQNEDVIRRYRVSNIFESTYENRLSQILPEKVLVVANDKTKKSHVIRLQQSWYDSNVAVNDIVSLIGDFETDNTCIVDNAQNMLILHPDILVSTTHVADAFSCLRRAVLQDRVRTTSQTNQYIMYGHMLHELLQKALEENKWDPGSLSTYIESILPRHLEEIAEINFSLEQVREHLRSKFPALQGWAAKFVGNWLRPISSAEDRGGSTVPLAITKLLDVEEHIWSPKYGLKGNVDATVEAFMHDHGENRRLVVPLELKTGKKFDNHRAQTALYTLLLSDRYDVDVKYGILYYLEDSGMMRIPAIRNELIHMIIKRNELACYISAKTELPPILKENRMCGSCYAQSSCFAYHRLLEDGAGENLNPKAKTLFDQYIRYLTPTHAEFFRKWDDLLTKEEKDSFQTRELWTMTSKERERVGRCLAHVTIEPGSFHALDDVSRINRYQYTFLRPESSQSSSSSRSTECELAVAEPIVISDERGHYFLAKGFVKRVDRHRVTVLVDRRLHNARIKQRGFDPEKNQSFTALMDVAKPGLQVKDSIAEDDEPIRYRLDKDEYGTGMATVRNNIIQIMDTSVFKARDLRSLIIDLRAPTFKPESSHVIASTQKSKMNVDQHAAIEKVMSAQEYALVLGMPGTGKTTTIAYIIKALVARGKSVLLTSYTHTAVDNILLKIRDGGFKILRIGVKAKIHPEVQEFAILADEPKESLEELHDSWQSPPVVAATCLSVNSRVFNQRTFDYCIVDEASQITLPACLGPIRMAKTFILVGDHHQLPPLVKNKKAAEGGLDVSLFKLLCETHPQATVSLEHQYRMCADIMSISNRLIYSGRLKCGNATTANLALRIPYPDALARFHFPGVFESTPQLAPTHPSSQWLCPGTNPRTCHLARLLQPSTKVLFLDTDPFGLASQELPTKGDRRQNPFEARLCHQLISCLLDCGVSASEIGLVTFYRSQLALLRNTFRDSPAGLEMSTADKFQGRDKDVVLVSFVRSNDAGLVGDLLLDRRRINVAVTRAKSKLILVGSRRTLLSAKRSAVADGDGAGGAVARAERTEGGELLRELVRMCDANGWVVPLHPRAIDGHASGGRAGMASTPTPTPGASPERSRRSHGAQTAEGAAGSPTRRTLGDADANCGGKGSAVRRRDGVRMAEKVGVKDGRVLLKSRPFARDILHEMLGAAGPS